MSNSTAKTAMRRVRMVQAHGRHCHWCGDRMGWPDGATHLSPTAMTFEHIIPKCKGGSNDPWNLVLACYDCNQERGLGFDFEPLRRWSCAPPQTDKGLHHG